MKYLVYVYTEIEVDAENEDEAVEKAAEEIREYKPKEFLFDVTTPNEQG